MNPANLNNMTTMKTPPTILELCEKATKGPWSCESSRGLIYGNVGNMICAMPHGIRTNGLLSQKEGVTDIITPNAQLIARLSPETVKAVYEALLPVQTIYAPPLQGGTDSDYFERGCSLTKPQIRAMQHALALLDGLPQQRQAI